MALTLPANLPTTVSPLHAATTKIHPSQLILSTSVRQNRSDQERIIEILKGKTFDNEDESGENEEMQWSGRPETWSGFARRNIKSRDSVQLERGDFAFQSEDYHFPLFPPHSEAAPPANQHPQRPGILANDYFQRHFPNGPRMNPKKGSLASAARQQTFNGLLSLLLLFLISVCGSIGCIFMMSALTVIESLQTRGNSYLVSLAMSHLLVTLFVIPSSALQIMAGEQGLDSQKLCHYQWLTLEFSLIVGNLSFVLIAVDNYLGYSCSEKVITKLAKEEEEEEEEQKEKNGENVNEKKQDEESKVGKKLQEAASIAHNDKRQVGEEDGPQIVCDKLRGEEISADCKVVSPFARKPDTPIGEHQAQTAEQSDKSRAQLLEREFFAGVEEQSQPKGRPSNGRCHRQRSRVGGLLRLDGAPLGASSCVCPSGGASAPACEVQRRQQRGGDGRQELPGEQAGWPHRHRCCLGQIGELINFVAVPILSGLGSVRAALARFGLGRLGGARRSGGDCGSEKIAPRLAEQFACEHEGARLERAGCCGYRFWCGRSRVLIWIFLSWFLSFFLVANLELSFGSKFCTQRQSSQRATVFGTFPSTYRQNHAALASINNNNNNNLQAAGVDGQELQRPIHWEVLGGESAKSVPMGDNRPSSRRMESDGLNSRAKLESIKRRRITREIPEQSLTDQSIEIGEQWLKGEQSGRNHSAPSWRVGLIMGQPHGRARRKEVAEGEAQVADLSGLQSAGPRRADSIWAKVGAENMAPAASQDAGRRPSDESAKSVRPDQPEKLGGYLSEWQPISRKGKAQNRPPGSPTDELSLSPGRIRDLPEVSKTETAPKLGDYSGLIGSQLGEKVERESRSEAGQRARWNGRRQIRLATGRQLERAGRKEAEIVLRASKFELSNPGEQTAQPAHKYPMHPQLPHRLLANTRDSPRFRERKYERPSAELANVGSHQRHDANNDVERETGQNGKAANVAARLGRNKRWKLATSGGTREVGSRHYYYSHINDKGHSSTSLKPARLEHRGRRVRRTYLASFSEPLSSSEGLLAAETRIGPTSSSNSTATPALLEHCCDTFPKLRVEHDSTNQAISSQEVDADWKSAPKVNVFRSVLRPIPIHSNDIEAESHETATGLLEDNISQNGHTQTALGRERLSKKKESGLAQLGAEIGQEDWDKSATRTKDQPMTNEEIRSSSERSVGGNDSSRAGLKEQMAIRNRRNERKRSDLSERKAEHDSVDSSKLKGEPESYHEEVGGKAPGKGRWSSGKWGGNLQPILFGEPQQDVHEKQHLIVGINPADELAEWLTERQRRLMNNNYGPSEGGSKSATSHETEFGDGRRGGIGSLDKHGRTLDAAEAELVRKLDAMQMTHWPPNSSEMSPKSPETGTRSPTNIWTRGKRNLSENPLPLDGSGAILDSPGSTQRPLSRLESASGANLSRHKRQVHQPDTNSRESPVQLEQRPTRPAQSSGEEKKGHPVAARPLFRLGLLCALILPTLVSSLLFGRAYFRMKKFRLRPYKPVPLATLAATPPALLVPRSPIPLVAQHQAYTFDRSDAADPVQPNMSSQGGLRPKELAAHCNQFADYSESRSTGDNGEQANCFGESGRNEEQEEDPGLSLAHAANEMARRVSAKNRGRKIGSNVGRRVPKNSDGNNYNDNNNNNNISAEGNHVQLNQVMSAPPPATVSSVRNGACVAHHASMRGPLPARIDPVDLPHQRCQLAPQVPQSAPVCPSRHDTAATRTSASQKFDIHCPSGMAAISIPGPASYSAPPTARPYTATLLVSRDRQEQSGVYPLEPRSARHSDPLEHHHAPSEPATASTFATNDFPRQTVVSMQNQSMSSAPNGQDRTQSMTTICNDGAAYESVGKFDRQKHGTPVFEPTCSGQTSGEMRAPKMSAMDQCAYRAYRHHAQSFHYGQQRAPVGSPILVNSEARLGATKLRRERPNYRSTMPLSQDHDLNSINHGENTLLSIERPVQRLDYASSSVRASVVSAAGNNDEHLDESRLQKSQQLQTVEASALRDANSVGDQLGCAQTRPLSSPRHQSLETRNGPKNGNKAAGMSEALVKVIQSVDVNLRSEACEIVQEEGLSSSAAGGQTRDQRPPRRKRPRPSPLSQNALSVDTTSLPPHDDLSAVKKTQLETRNSLCAHESSTKRRANVILCTYNYMTDDQLLKSNILVFTINFLLWLPFIILTTILQLSSHSLEQRDTSTGSTDNELLSGTLTQEFKDLVWWLATLNCCSCSYLYALTNKDFREAFNKLFYYCCCKSHVTFQRKTPIFRRQLDMDSKGNVRVHIIPGMNAYSNKLSASLNPFEISPGAALLGANPVGMLGRQNTLKQNFSQLGQST